jgi:DNA-binding HxlR family transcriptional regulator
MANTETIRERRVEGKELPPVSKEEGHTCEFENYDALLLMTETAKMRKLITKRGTLEILIPLSCSTSPVRYKKINQVMKGFSTRTLTNRLDELRKNGIIERYRYNEIPPRVEYQLTTKGRELAVSIVDLFRWMRKWANTKGTVKLPQQQPQQVVV